MGGARAVAPDASPAHGSPRLVERLLAWVQNFRRLVTRFEYHAGNFLSFVQLGCIIILLRAFVR